MGSKKLILFGILFCFIALPSFALAGTWNWTILSDWGCCGDASPYPTVKGPGCDNSKCDQCDEYHTHYWRPIDYASPAFLADWVYSGHYYLIEATISPNYAYVECAGGTHSYTDDCTGDECSVELSKIEGEIGVVDPNNVVDSTTLFKWNTSASAYTHGECETKCTNKDSSISSASKSYCYTYSGGDKRIYGTTNFTLKGFADNDNDGDTEYIHGNTEVPFTLKVTELSSIDSSCEGKAVGASCGVGGTCNASCKCVTPCTRANPTVTATNSPQSGNPGDTKTFNFDIKNNDTTTCGNSTFNLTKSCPSGWTCTLNKTSVAISPGSTDSTVTLSVTSPTTAAAGDYTVSVTATNSGATSYKGTGSAIYTVILVCTRADPTLSLSPSSQSGNPGDTKSYTATIKNNDTTACGDSTFNLTKTCPSGWTCSLSSTSKTISPGSSASVTLSATSPTTATAGDYTVKVKATNSSDTSYWDEDSAIYTVTVACTRDNPGVSISPSSQSGNPGQTLSYTATIINYDSSGCGSSTFNLTKSCPSGWTCSLSSSTITISPNGSAGAVSLSVTSPTTATVGDYTVSVTATNSAATSYSGTGSATYTVTAAGVAINPPSVTTNAATSIISTSATLNGYLHDLGYVPATCPSCSCIVWFKWKLSTAASWNETTPFSMTGAGPFTTNLSELSSGKEYYFEAFAKNGGSW